MKKVAVVVALVVAVVALVTVLSVDRSPSTPESGATAGENPAAAVRKDTAGGKDAERCAGQSALQSSGIRMPDDLAAGPAPRAVDEDREAEGEKAVDGFDALTDKWIKPTEKGVPMAEVDRFVKAFRQIPKQRRNECIHRALNLIPDDNVMLLAGVLMDRTMDREIVETVYSDILNRSDDVKKPILREIFKDKTHPCWVNTAWILDVTGDLPKGK